MIKTRGPSVTAGKSRKARDQRRRLTRQEQLQERAEKCLLSPAERRELLKLQADSARKEYLRGVDRQRLANIGKAGKQARDLQAVVYAAIGLDMNAGYDGRPPAFLPEEDVNEASAGGKGFRTVRDPLALLHRKGSIDEGQYKAALDFLELQEAYTSIGGRGVQYGERVDGGKAPDVPLWQMSVVQRWSAYRHWMGDTRLQLLIACTSGNALHVVAGMGRWGRDTRTVLKHLRAALDHAGRFSR